jgi:hypothetical protein
MNTQTLTRHSLANHLYRSRSYDYELKRYFYRSEVADLVRQLEEDAAARGVNFSRWETTQGKWGKRITYALHTGERQAQFRYMPQGSVIDVCVLDQVEGTSRRCEAYRGLSSLMDALLERDEVDSE